MAISHISKGQPDWDKVVNQIIDSLGAKWSAWTSSGITLLNGAKPTDSDNYPSYRTLQVNGVQFVQFRFYLTNLTKGDDTLYISLPSNIFPTTAFETFQEPNTNGRSVTWILQNSQLKLHSNSDQTYDPDYWYPFREILAY